VFFPECILPASASLSLQTPCDACACTSIAFRKSRTRPQSTANEVRPLGSSDSFPSGAEGISLSTVSAGSEVLTNPTSIIPDTRNVSVSSSRLSDSSYYFSSTNSKANDRTVSNGSSNDSNHRRNEATTDKYEPEFHLQESMHPAEQLGFSPNQCTVNRYQAGHGIPPHVDTHSAFSDLIVALSLGGSTVMDFRLCSPVDGVSIIDRKAVEIPSRCLMVMAGPSRYCWTHGIAPRRSDLIDGKLVARETRTSLTFRRILVPQRCECPCPAHCFRDAQLQQQKVKEVPQGPLPP
jgi:alkylated DNA repair dioxygenase AlkB